MKYVLPSVSNMIKEYSINANKKFGQNFLFDKKITDKIVENIPNLESSVVIEVGPGPGCLTRSLLDSSARKIIAIEKDFLMNPILEKIKDFYGNKFHFIFDDALNFFNNYDLTYKENICICSNLPYNIGTELLIKWIKDLINNKYWIDSFTLMFQKEVAKRIIANSSDKEYCRLSVLVSLISNVRKILFNVPSGAFHPSPKVDSAVVQIIPDKSKINNIDIEKLEFLTQQLFNQRRKMIRSIMPDINWNEFNLFGTERAENLSPLKFLEISKKIVKK